MSKYKKAFEDAIMSMRRMQANARLAAMEDNCDLAKLQAATIGTVARLSEQILAAADAAEAGDE